MIATADITDEEYAFTPAFCIDQRFGEEAADSLTALQFKLLMTLAAQMGEDNRVYAHPAAIAVQLRVQSGPVRNALANLVARNLLIATRETRTYVVNPRYFFLNEYFQEDLEVRFPHIACAPAAVRHLSIVP